jgi:hypothetical protein
MSAKSSAGFAVFHRTTSVQQIGSAVADGNRPDRELRFAPQPSSAPPFYLKSVNSHETVTALRRIGSCRA